MKIKMSILAVLALCLCAPILLRAQEDRSAALQQAQHERIAAKLQASFDSFPLLTPAVKSKGRVEFQAPAVTNPVVIDFVNYYGFRFKVPKRTNNEDLIAAMILPAGVFAGGFVVTANGAVQGVETHLRVSKTNYLNTGQLVPPNQDTLLIRYLAGDSIQDGDTDLMWWVINGKPAPTSLAFVFARLDGKAADALAALEEALGLTHASSTPVVLLDSAPAVGPTLRQQMQASFLQFPLLAPATDEQGKPKFQNFPVMKPMVFGTNLYYGFRFTVPKRDKAEDFVWGMIRPFGLAEWSIVRVKGGMHGFENFRYMAKTNYVNTARLLPQKQKQMILQSLSGESFIDGETYIIWWHLTKEPEPMSLVFTFAPLGPDGVHNQLPPMEKALGLVPATSAQGERR